MANPNPGSKSPPPRVDPADTSVSAAPATDRLVGTSPDFRYEWRRADEVNDYLKGVPLKSGKRGPKWRVVHEDENGVEDIRVMRKFSDDGEGCDTVVRNRSDVLMAIPNAEHEAYLNDHEEFLVKTTDKLVHQGETHTYAGGLNAGGITQRAQFNNMDFKDLKRARSD